MSNTKKTRNKQTAKQFKVAFTDHAWEDYLYWQKQDPGKIAAINKLIEDCHRDPFKGIGKPEPLVGNLTGYWSRRIDKEHRLVYIYENGSLHIVQCRYHY